MPTVTVLNDIHLKPAYEDIVEEFKLPPSTDGVVIAGDLLDNPDAESVDMGRRLLSRLDQHEVPTVVVPGNHDPLECSRELVAGFGYIQLGHGRSVSADVFPEGADVFETLTTVGWGCTQFDAGCELDYEAASSFDIRTEHGHVDRYNESRAVETLLGAVDHLVTGQSSPDAIRDELGLPPSAHAALAQIAEVCEQLCDHLADERETLLATHVPPFGTDLDLHHSAENREDDGLHLGSLAVAAAIRSMEPTVAVSGHSHVRGYRTYDTAPTHLLNGGFRGVTTIDIGNGVGFSFHDPDWLPGDG